jgi:Family of unknown function (DUF6610)
MIQLNSSIRTHETRIGGEPSRWPLKFIAHSFRAASIAVKYGWLPGARYSNLRDARKFERLGFLDISWKDYNFNRHLRAAKATRPIMTVARDVDDIGQLGRTLDEARELLLYAEYVVIVPKDAALRHRVDELIPSEFVLGYSVPTRYGGTSLSLDAFSRPVHLLGGRPDVQRRLALQLKVASLDCNRFTLDAAFGDFFDGRAFRPHPTGGYDVCLEASVKYINELWAGYTPASRRF